jgi:hypothetical protein
VGVGVVVPPHGQLLVGLGPGGVSSVVMVGPGAVVEAEKKNLQNRKDCQ